ncbi:MAG TPA: hypothetical protein VG844_09040 [Terracidiphilus sp.]|jgi:hypothetical protein|nr:hypothetical protein [Terracidiphilus sp.]
MSDTTPRNSTAIPQMLADALLRSLGGTTAMLRVTGANTSSNQAEVGLVSTMLYEVVLGPVAMRRLRPTWKRDEPSQWELLVSATSVEDQVSILDLPSAQSLFSMTLGVSVAGQDYLIESVAGNEAFGQTYLYRLILREVRAQAL